MVGGRISPDAVCMNPPAGPNKVYDIGDQESWHARCRMLRSAGLLASAYATVDEFIAECAGNGNACVIADVRMSGTGGLAVPAALYRIGGDLLVIIVTNQDGDSARADAKPAGAVAFFRKPSDGQALLDAIEWATQDGGAGLTG